METEICNMIHERGLLNSGSFCCIITLDADVKVHTTHEHENIYVSLRYRIFLYYLLLHIMEKKIIKAAEMGTDFSPIYVKNVIISTS